MKKAYYLLLLLLAPLFTFAQEVYNIRFYDEGTSYNVAVIMFEDNKGMVRVKFDDGNCGFEFVEMKATITETTDGYTINCTDPVEPGTTQKVRTYNPDNFILTFKEDDGWICKNKDSANSVSDCFFTEVTGITNQDIFLQEFGLQFDK